MLSGRMIGQQSASGKEDRRNYSRKERIDGLEEAIQKTTERIKKGDVDPVILGKHLKNLKEQLQKEGVK